MLQTDETPVLVNKDGRDAGSKSYMWVYRTGQMYGDCPIILYEYQKTRNASHPRKFLQDFRGVFPSPVPKDCGYRKICGILFSTENYRTASVLILKETRREESAVWKKNIFNRLLMQRKN